MWEGGNEIKNKKKMKKGEIRRREYKGKKTKEGPLQLSLNLISRFQ